MERMEIENVRCRLVNWTFLVTVLFYMGASMMLSGWLAETDSLVLRLGISQVVLAIPAAGYLLLNRVPLTEAIRLKPLRPSRILLLVLFSGLVMPFMSFINALSLTVTTNQATAGLYGLSGLPLPVSLLFAALLPAVLEETIYRGVFFQEYRKISVRRGILLSGLLFGLMHLNLNQFSYAFVMGCIFALVIEVTDTILSTMIIHFMINASSTIATYLVGDMQILTEAASTRITAEEVLQTGAAAVVPTILAVLVLVWLSHLEGREQVWKELFGRRQTEVKDQKKQHLITLPLAAGILICLGYIVLYEYSIRFGR